MMLRPHLPCWLTFATILSPILAQAPAVPRMVAPTRVNHGVAGHLTLTDGTSQPFHLEVSATRARLLPTYNAPEQVPGLPFGSAEELRLLALLQAWTDAELPLADRPQALAALRHSPRNEAEDLAHKRATLLQTLDSYRRVTRPQVDQVFAGRATVALSLRLRLGDAPPCGILWRQLGEDRFARLHVDDTTTPVALDSQQEREILLALRYWLIERVGDAALVDGGELGTGGEPERLVHAARRGYLAATSPRLRSSGTVMDGNPGGSRVFELSDADNRVHRVRFDYSAGSSHRGRMLDGGAKDSPLVPFGSAREGELLGMLRRAAAIRRTFLGDAADADQQLVSLEREIIQYEKLAAAAK
jgi:hypothetical protein